MFHKLILSAMVCSCLFAFRSTVGQQHGQYFGPPSQQFESNCQGCQTGGGHSFGGSYADSGPWVEQGYSDQGFDSSCGCAECVGTVNGGIRTPIRNALATRKGGPDCADCNWGPVYLSLFGGVSFIDNFDSRFTFDNGMAGMIGVQETGFSVLDGVAAGGSIGRYFYQRARGEFEYTYRENNIGDMQVFTYSDDTSTPQINDTLVSSVITPADGSIESNSFMFNIVFDLRPRTVGCINGYLGGGIGALSVDGDTTTAMANFLIDDSSFAFQGIAGINYPIRDRIDLFSEYRYLGADNINVERTDMAGVTSLGAFRFDSHNVVFGVRILR